jgi:hypothetical protein
MHGGPVSENTIELELVYAAASRLFYVEFFKSFISKVRKQVSCIVSAIYRALRRFLSRSG